MTHTRCGSIQGRGSHNVAVEAVADGHGRVRCGVSKCQRTDKVTLEVKPTLG